MKYLLTAASAAALLFGAMSATAANRSDPAFIAAHPGGSGTNGGGTCATPVTIGALPFTQAGDTCGSANNINSYPGGTCGTSLASPYPGPDDVWAITVGAGNSIDVSADLTGSTGDLALFFLSTCGDGNSCLANSQDAIGAGAGPEIIPTITGLTSGNTYYIYVDSYYASGAASCGSYTLNVAGTLPVTLESYQID